MAEWVNVATGTCPKEPASAGQLPWVSWSRACEVGVHIHKVWLGNLLALTLVIFIRYLLLITSLLRRWEVRLGFFFLRWTRNSPYGFWGLVTRTLLIMRCHISWNPQTVRLLGFLTLAFLLVCHNSSTIQTGVLCMFGLQGQQSLWNMTVCEK